MSEESGLISFGQNHLRVGSENGSEYISRGFRQKITFGAWRTEFVRVK
jgi:hypothetical protein